MPAVCHLERAYRGPRGWGRSARQGNRRRRLAQCLHMLYVLANCPVHGDVHAKRVRSEPSGPGGERFDGYLALANLTTRCALSPCRRSAGRWSARAGPSTRTSVRPVHPADRARRRQNAQADGRQRMGLSALCLLLIVHVRDGGCPEPRLEMACRPVKTGEAVEVWKEPSLAVTKDGFPAAARALGDQAPARRPPKRDATLDRFARIRFRSPQIDSTEVFCPISAPETTFLGRETKSKIGANG
jgi:hypothetical protein